MLNSNENEESSIPSEDVDKIIQECSDRVERHKVVDETGKLKRYNVDMKLIFHEVVQEYSDDQLQKRKANIKPAKKN